MPYLFWAVLPFALIDTWWGMCERRRDTESTAIVSVSEDTPGLPLWKGSVKRPGLSLAGC
jgi:hypothetical protein